jgi:hypothetical protein
MRPEVRHIERALQEAMPGAALQVTREAASTVQADYEVLLSMSGVRTRLLVEWVNNPSTAMLRHKATQLRERARRTPRALPAMLAPFLTKSQQEWLRQAGVAYVDLEGNAWIQAKGVYVDKVGPRVESLRRPVAPNPFSDKASVVLRQLLLSRAPSGVREMAGVTGLSAGYVSKVVSRLLDLGYVSSGTEGKTILADADAVLKDWASAYDFSKNRMSGYFCRAREATEVIERIRKWSPEIDYALTAQAGAYLVSPYASFDRVDLYVSKQEDVEALVDGLGLEQVERGGNLFAGVPYYRHSAFFGARVITGLKVVSDLQLYLDLLKYPLRGSEQAQHLLENSSLSSAHHGT